MNLVIRNIKVDNQTVESTLCIDVDIEFYEGIEVPISITGQMMLNGKIISLLGEYKKVSAIDYELIVHDQKAYENKTDVRSNFKRLYSAQLSTKLSPAAIEYIELQREKHPEKSVSFQFEFVLKSILLKFIPKGTGGPQNTDELLKISVTKPYGVFTINHSDWVNHFTEPLGIGKFLLVGLAIPSVNVPVFWRALYEKLNGNLSSIEACLKSGEWQQAMLHLRKFYENIKIGDDKPGHKKFRQELDKLLKDDQHGEKGINHFYNALWQLFEFFSKFIHDKDTQGNPNPTPIPHKEDAYLGYSMAVGLLNFIGMKLNRKL